MCELPPRNKRSSHLLGKRGSSETSSQEAEDDDGSDVGRYEDRNGRRQCLARLDDEALKKKLTQCATDLETEVRHPSGEEDDATTVTFRQRAPNCAKEEQECQRRAQKRERSSGTYVEVRHSIQRRRLNESGKQTRSVRCDATTEQAGEAGLT